MYNGEARKPFARFSAKEERMLTNNLPPELEKTITEQAQRNGTTPELFLLDDLRQRYLPQEPQEPSVVEGQTMADFLKDYIGCINGSEIYPEGSRLSEDTGRKFAELIGRWSAPDLRR